MRIKGRAIRRMGELLKEVEPAKGGRPRTETSTGGGTSLESRKRVADGAGLSKRQKDEALRVASIPARDFEHDIEAEQPTTCWRPS